MTVTTEAADTARGARTLVPSIEDLAARLHDARDAARAEAARNERVLTALLRDVGELRARAIHPGATTPPPVAIAPAPIDVILANMSSAGLELIRELVARGTAVQEEDSDYLICSVDTLAQAVGCSSQAIRSRWGYVESRTGAAGRDRPWGREERDGSTYLWVKTSAATAVLSAPDPS